jgi:ankyrin repeat protein
VHGIGSGHVESFSETQTSGFVEGLPDSNWVRGLEQRDCKTLLQLLERSPNSWVETTHEGRNVLHVAIIQGCTELVKQVLKLPPQGSSRSFVDDDSFSNNLPSLKTLLNVTDGRCKVDVFCLASIVGNQDVIQILDKATHKQKVERQAEDDNAESQANDDDNAESQANDDDNIGNDCLRGLMQNALKLSKNARFKSIIEKDVDYNFEDPKRKELLIFHCACKRAHLFKKFIHGVVEMAQEQGVLRELFQLKDAQGRTPLHVAVDLGRVTTQELLDLLPKEAEFADCINARDGAGRTPLHRAVANNLGFSYSRVAEILVNDIRTDVNAEWRDDGMTALHLAILHNDPGTAELLIAAKGADGSQRVDVAKTITRDISVYKTAATSWTALELATVMGISTVVQAFTSQVCNPHTCSHNIQYSCSFRILGSSLNFAHGFWSNFD